MLAVQKKPRVCGNRLGAGIPIGVGNVLLTSGRGSGHA